MPKGLATTAVLALGAILSTGCAGSSVGDSLEKSLEADPQLEEQGALFGNPAAETDDESPRSSPGATQAEASREEESTAPSERNLLPPGERSGALSSEASSSNTSTNPSARETASPGQASFDRGALADVPEDLQPYIEDLMALRIFSRAVDLKTNSSDSAVTFEPNQPITRGQYANWLLAANNFFYSDQPSQKIRLASRSATPAFQDVPRSHPYFGAIQGLAEAGLIPSALTGNSTAVNFRPDAPLTRESLVLWKVPLDIRTALPTASIDAVKATWGFQDAAEIEPLALRAVLADHQTGDFANILRAFGYTTLFQPQKAVTQAEAAATLWRFGIQTEGITAAELLKRDEGEPGAAP